MSSPVITIAEIELPVLSAAILGGLGWLIRGFIQNRKEQRAQAATVTQRLIQLGERMALNRENYTELRRDVDTLKRQVPQLSENLAVLATEFDKHEEWHEGRRGNALRD